jgi:hypothetical protein
LFLKKKEEVMKKNYLLDIFYCENIRNEGVDEIAKTIIGNREKFKTVDFNQWTHKENRCCKITIFLSELNNNIELFNSPAQEVIKHLNQGAKNTCIYCGTVTLNTIPYTYRDNGGCIGRSYECLDCRCLEKYDDLRKVGDERNIKGEAEAKKLAVKILRKN